MALRMCFTTTAIVLILTLGGSTISVSPAAAQTTEAPPAPAPLGETVLQDALASPGLIAAFRCVNGRAMRDFADEGLTVRVNGRCAAGDTGNPGLATGVSGLTVPDGEVRIEARALAGADRLSLRVGFRIQPGDGPAIGYRVHVDPGMDAVSIVKQTPEGAGPIARRTGIGRQLGSGTWMAISVRFAGPHIWVFLDDALVLNAVDETFATGEVGVFTTRLGNPDDDSEIAVTLRNFRVAALAASDPDRLPRTAERASLPSAPPVGEVIMNDPQAQTPILAAGTCPTGLASVERVDEGALFKTRGRCHPESTSATIAEVVRGLSVLDGEVAISFKIVSGSPRTSIALSSRVRDRAWLSVFLNPVTGSADLYRSDDGNPRTLARRGDAQRLARHGDWNRLALRLDGPEVWVLLNDQPLLYSNEGDLGVGGAVITVYRSGNLDDDQESAVVFADLKASALADGDPALRPTFRQP